MQSLSWQVPQPSQSARSDALLAPVHPTETSDAVDTRVSASESDVTALLRRWRAGDSEAFERLLPRVYHQLHRLARGAMRGERRDHTLQATALIMAS